MVNDDSINHVSILSPRHVISGCLFRVGCSSLGPCSQLVDQQDMHLQALRPLRPPNRLRIHESTEISGSFFGGPGVPDRSRLHHRFRRGHQSPFPPRVKQTEAQFGAALLLPWPWKCGGPRFSHQHLREDQGNDQPPVPVVTCHI